MDKEEVGEISRSDLMTLQLQTATEDPTKKRQRKDKFLLIIMQGKGLEESFI